MSTKIQNFYKNHCGGILKCDFNTTIIIIFEQLSIHISSPFKQSDLMKYLVALDS